MATAFLSTTSSILSSTLSFSSLSSLANTPVLLFCRQQKHNAKRQVTLCKAFSEPAPPSPILNKRSLSVCFITSFVFSLASRGNSTANAAILEADDDEELLERVKRDRKKRIERQGVINSSNKETGWIPCIFYICANYI